MSEYLTIVVEVGDTDPRATDPHEVAEDLLDAYKTEIRAGNALFSVAGFVSAEWGER